MKNYLISVVIREIKIKGAMTFIFIQLAISKKAVHINC